MQIVSIILLNSSTTSFSPGIGNVILGPAQPLQKTNFTFPKFFQSQVLGN